MEYKQAGHEHPDIYERIYDLAEETADIRYWSSLAKKERKFKDRKDKVPSIDFVPANGNTGEAQDYEVDSDMDDDDEDITGNFARNIGGSPTIQSPTESQGQIEPAKRKRGGHVITPNKKAKVGQQQHRRLQQQQQAPEPDGEEVVEIYIGNGTDQKVFHLSRNNINKSSFLKGLIQGKLPYIFHPLLHQMKSAEFEPVYAFLSRNESPDSDLVSVHGDEVQGDDDYWEDILGDVGRMGKHWKLKDVHNTEDLKAYILQLRPAFTRACLLGLSKIAGNITTNIQVAWNVYGRVEQLPIYLDFIEGVIQDLARGKGPGAFHSDQFSYGFDTSSQSWVVRFLAETFVLCATELPQRFWSLMDKYPNLRAAVFKHRAILDDAKILELEKKFRQRECLDEADFAIPAKVVKSTEQETAVKDETKMEQVSETLAESVEEEAAEKDGEGAEQMVEANE